MGQGDAIGDVVTGALVAGAVDQARSGAGVRHGDGGACLNCGAALLGAYCAACGQPAHVHRTMVSLGHDFLHGVFHFEGKLGATLPLLVRRPGELTRRYVHGERAKFISPLALFLFSVFLLFAVIGRLDLPGLAGTTQGLVEARHQLLDRQTRAEDRLRALRRQRSAAAANPRDAARLDTAVAAASREVASLRDAAGRITDRSIAPAKGAAKMAADEVDTGWPALDRQVRHVLRNPALYTYKLQSASYKYSWALIPISLPFIWAMFFWHRGVGMYDHAIFAIYSLSFMTLLVVALAGLAMLGVSPSLLWLAMLVVPPIHMFRQLRGAYLVSRFGALWRTATLLLATAISGTLFFALLLWLEAE